MYPFGSDVEFGPTTLVAGRSNIAFPVLPAQSATGSAPWAEVKPASPPHPGTRREARERERSRQATQPEQVQPEPSQDQQSGTGTRTVPKGLAVNTTRALVLAGLIAGGWTQVSGMGGVASADDIEADLPAALGEIAVDLPLSDFVREPMVNESAMLERSHKISAAKAKAAALAAQKRAKARAQAAAQAKARAEALSRATREANRDPKAVARLMVADRGWSSSQFSCLDKLWTKESGWNYRAQNRSSGAYGIPQALPGTKMGTVADDWRTNAVTQITWGLKYIADRYGTPCGAWAHSVSHNWY